MSIIIRKSSHKLLLCMDIVNIAVQAPLTGGIVAYIYLSQNNSDCSTVHVDLNMKGVLQIHQNEITPTVKWIQYKGQLIYL